MTAISALSTVPIIRSGGFTGLVLLLLEALVVYLIGLCVYRIWFHPLSKFPGPLRYKISGWPLVWQAYRGNRHLFHLRDHEEYGPVLRIAPNTLSFSTHDALHTIYSTSKSTPIKKAEFYKTFDIAAGAYSSFTETDVESHAIKRRWMAPIFSEKRVGEAEGKLIGIIEGFCSEVGKTAGEKEEAVECNDGWSKKIDMATMAVYLGFDLMGALVFGEDFATVRTAQYRPLADSILPASRIMYWISHLPIAALVRPLLRTRLVEVLGGKDISDNNRLIAHASSQVASRLSIKDYTSPIDAPPIPSGPEGASNKKSDFATYLTTASDKKTGWKPTRVDLDVECLNLMMAGTDPYSTVLAATMFYLVHNPSCLAKLTEEIRTTFPHPSKISSSPPSPLPTLPYLHAILLETLRHSTPVPSHLPRLTTAPVTISGHLIPSGTEVGCSAHVLHHNDAYFSAPFEFVPERWLNPEAANEKDDTATARGTATATAAALAPFSLGTRACSGKSVAWTQLKLTLAHLLWRYDIRLTTDEQFRRVGGGGERGLGAKSWWWWWNRGRMEPGREREDEYQMWDALGFGREGPWVEVRRRG